MSTGLDALLNNTVHIIFNIKYKKITFAKPTFTLVLIYLKINL